MLEEQVRILKLENKKLEEERKSQLNIIERLTETQDSDIRKEAGNGWTRVRPNICTTEKYIQTQQQLQKSKVVPRNKTYTGTLRESKKSLMIGDSHIRKVKRDKLQNSFDNAKSFVRYFSGAKTEDLHHYIISSLEAVNYYHKALHLGCCGSPRSASDIGSNNITHRTIYILFNMIYSKNEAFRDTSHHDVKYHE